MNFLITGAAGFIGSNLSLKLLEQGHQVTGLDCFNDYYSLAIKESTRESLERNGISILRLDLATDLIEPGLEGVDAVVHFAAQPGISATTSWDQYYRNNVLATHRLLEAAKQSSVKQFVNVATSSIYGLHATDPESAAPKPASWYGVSKLAAEQEILAAYRSIGFPVCSVRPFSVFGERERPEKLFPRLISSVANNTAFPLYQGAREHLRSFTYVKDICDAIIAILQNWERTQGEIFNIGSDQCFTTGEGIEAVQEIMGKSVIIDEKPPRPGDQLATHANIDKIRKLTGWEPSTSIFEGLERMVEWYLKDVHRKINWS